MIPDLYAVLGVTNKATPEDIKRAFRELSKQWHPDVCKEDGAELRFKQINEAYKILSDPESRVQYEEDLKRQVERESYQYSFQTIYNSVFSSPVSGRQPVDGENIVVDISFSLDDIYQNQVKKIRFKRNKLCVECSGRRYVGGDGGCKSCGGFGSYKRSVATPFGRIDALELCSACKGYGRAKAKECISCCGSGQMLEDVVYELQLHKEIAHKSKIRKVGLGHPGREGGIPGDLIIYCYFSDSNYKINAYGDVETTITVPFEDWLANRPIACQLPDGSVHAVTLPSRFRKGEKICVPEYGLYQPDTHKFSAWSATLELEIPNWTDKQCEQVIGVTMGGSIHRKS